MRKNLGKCYLSISPIIKLLEGQYLCGDRLHKFIDRVELIPYCNLLFIAFLRAIFKYLTLFLFNGSLSLPPEFVLQDNLKFDLSSTCLVGQAFDESNEAHVIVKRKSKNGKRSLSPAIIPDVSSKRIKKSNLDALPSSGYAFVSAIESKQSCNLPPGPLDRPIKNPSLPPRPKPSIETVSSALGINGVKKSKAASKNNSNKDRKLMGAQEKLQQETKLKAERSKISRGATALATANGPSSAHQDSSKRSVAPKATQLSHVNHDEVTKVVPTGKCRLERPDAACTKAKARNPRKSQKQEINTELEGPSDLNPVTSPLARGLKVSDASQGTEDDRMHNHSQAIQSTRIQEVTVSTNEQVESPCLISPIADRELDFIGSNRNRQMNAQVLPSGKEKCSFEASKISTLVVDMNSTASVGSPSVVFQKPASPLSEEGTPRINF
jgi:hypothetical protein